MTLVNSIDKIVSWLTENVCSKITLKLPDDYRNDTGYDVVMVNPAAFPLYVPGKDRLPPNVAAPIPSVCVQLMEGSDELIQKKRQLQIRLCLACWNPGQHGGEIFNPRENAKATGGYSYYVNTGEAAKTYSTASSLWNTISSTVSSKISAASSAVRSATSTITSVASSAWSSVSSTASSQWESIRSTISSKLSSAKSTVSSLMSGITSTMSSGLSSALSTVSGKFSSIYSTISSKMSAARDAVGNAISALKSKFNFSWSLPHLKLPHVSISGSFSINPPSVPHFGISWYKDGGILTRPTIFGAAGNNLLAGGEAGAEAVVPLATLWDKLETMITSVFNTASTTGGSSGEGLTSTAGRLLTLDDFSLGSLADSGGVVVYYDFSGFTWSPQIQTEGTGDDADDFMAKLKAHEAEFFDWLEEFIKMREVAQYA